MDERLSIPTGKSTGRSWTDEEAQFARELKRAGKTHQEIADRLGRSRNSISGFFERLSRVGEWGRK